MRHPRLFVTRGLPGSGKSTVAAELVENGTIVENGEVVGFTVVATSRDEFRTMFNGRRLGLGRQEQLVSAAQDAAILAALGLKLDVVVHDTNLREGDIRRFRDLAKQAGAELHVIDLRDVPLAECIRRDALRQGTKRIGADKIREMHAEHIAKPGVTTATLAAVASARATR